MISTKIECGHHQMVGNTGWASNSFVEKIRNQRINKQELNCMSTIEISFTTVLKK